MPRYPEGAGGWTKENGMRMECGEWRLVLRSWDYGLKDYKIWHDLVVFVAAQDQVVGKGMHRAIHTQQHLGQAQ